MPTAGEVATLALQALIDELGTLQEHQIERISSLGHETSDRVAAATTEALEQLEAADRLAPFEAATQRLAAACLRLGIPQPARAAAFSALVGLVASDLLPPATFRTLYEAWEEGLGGVGGSSAILKGEEVLLHIE